MHMVSKSPSILHLDKDDLLWRFLLLGKVIDTKTGKLARETYVLEKPRTFTISQDVLYARIKYLESEDGMPYRRKKDYLTVRQIIGSSKEEFENSYKISNDELLKKFPFDNAAQLEVVGWDVNEEILNTIWEKGKIK